MLASKTRLKRLIVIVQLQNKKDKMQHSKVAIITGGGRGIGAATAKLFAQQGYAVCINYKSNVEAANKVAAEIEVAGGKCILVQADVSQEKQVEALFAEVDKRLGSVSVLVNNVGILRQQTQLVDMDAERINFILTHNVTSFFLCCREAIKRMSTTREFNGKKGLGGSIVNVSSGAAKSGSPNEYIDYAASKGAIDTLTVGLAKEVVSEGIRVNCVRPGMVYTTMHADGGEPNRVDRLAATKIPMQRGGQPEEIAEAIYWLASDKSSYSTGTFVDATGGI